MGSIARMDSKLPTKCQDVSWPTPPTPSFLTYAYLLSITLLRQCLVVTVAAYDLSFIQQ